MKSAERYRKLIRAFLVNHESCLAVDGVSYMPGVHKVSMVRMNRDILTNLRMYGSRHKCCRNAAGGKIAIVWVGK
ncbi:hypothetical protein AAHB53_20155 [Niallia circulans]